ncbi:hypothetical protein [Devosia sp. RR2S18]|uniref:hypothetical protein n=1 Tax=Devosia rhizosphaerae TaxID=3049774 RepID=UPI00253FED5D|nr:hypothetical protein [Devosia sp. RR2S18]WIJ24980.1 hypothetical protein QOV41_18525 [Devosia sp. RR2S18]
MDRQAAVHFIKEYRAQVKRWNLVLAGIETGSLSEVERWLDSQRPALDEIALEHSTLAQTAMTLSSFRGRTYHSGRLVKA